jgi:hypothetical protein
VEAEGLSEELLMKVKNSIIDGQLVNNFFPQQSAPLLQEEDQPFL